MKIILSPAKQMKYVEDVECLSTPKCIKQAEEILSVLQKMDYDALKKMWNCSDNIARKAYDNLMHTKLDAGVSPAIYAYSGIAYKYMNPDAFTDDMSSYVQTHLRILSGLYGVLRPFDGIVPYRLEMQASLTLHNYHDLYEYWNRMIYEALEDDVIINLASKEYSQCVEPYARKVITCVFGEIVKDKIVQKGVYAKMARGAMVSFMAEHQIEDENEMKKFNELGFRYDETRSDENTYVFIKGS